MISLQQKLQVEKEYHFCAYNFTGKRGLDGTIPILYNSCKNDKKYENQFNPDILNKYERQLFINQPIDVLEANLEIEPSLNLKLQDKFMHDLGQYC